METNRQLFEVRKRAIRKSTITKEGSLEEAPISDVPQGAPTDEMKNVHFKEVKKWAGDIGDMKIGPGEEDDDDYTPGKKLLDFECAYKIPNQEYAVLSVVGSTGNNQRIPIKIRGIFPGEKEARDHITKLMQMDDTYDTLPMPLYKWVPCDPDISSLRHVYKDKKLNHLLETDENQNEESLGFHQAKRTHGTLEEPLNPTDNFEGKGTMFKSRFLEEEEEEGNPFQADISSQPTSYRVKYDFKPGDRIDGKISEDEQTASNALADLEVSDVGTFSFNPGLVSQKPIQMFEKVDNEMKKLEEQISNMVLTEGITEEEARDRLRLKFDVRESRVHEVEDLPKVVKEPVKKVDFESMAKLIDELKEKGLDDKEIRKIISEM